MTNLPPAPLEPPHLQTSLPKFLSGDLLLANSGWLSIDMLACNPAALRDALSIPGLLTLALEHALGGPVAVHCVQQVPWSDSMRLVGLRRDVLLVTGAHDRMQVHVAASTFLPHRVIAALPWLEQLGNRPLGAALVDNIPHNRRQFEFLELDARRVFALAGRHHVSTWVRRYRITLPSGELLVTETFHPLTLRIMASANSGE